MTFWNVVLLVISVIVASGIVHKAKVSNYWMILVIPLVLVLCYVVIWVLKLAILLLPVIILGGILWFIINRLAKKDLE